MNSIIPKNSIGWLSLFILLTGCHVRNNNHSTNREKMNIIDSLPEKVFLFGDDPGFLQCHASTLIHLKDGEFIAAWFGGTEEGADDVGIWMTTGRPGRWEKPFEVAKIKDEPHWNPVLFQAPSGKIFLFFKVGKEIAHWETWVKTSDDKGKTWSKAYELIPGDDGGRGPVRNKPILLSNGDWLAGASNEDGLWNVFFDRSEDQGKTWQATPYLKLDRKSFKGKGIIQPTLWESAPGHIHALLRSSEGYIFRTDSKDYGNNWSAAYKTNLPNPNSAIDVFMFSKDTLALVCNVDSANWGSRGTLVLALSYDNGITWPKRVIIEAGKKEDEFSYPAIIGFGDTVAVTYTWQRKKIAFWMATKDWILKYAEPFKINKHDNQ